MPDPNLTEITGKLAANPDWKQAALRVEILLRDAPPDPELPAAPSADAAQLRIRLQDFLQRAQSPTAAPSELPEYLIWLLNRQPPAFWAGLGTPDLELIRLYPTLLELGGPENTAMISDQFGWMLSRGGARRVTALVLTSLGNALDAKDTLLYLRLCEVVLRQALAPFPPGLRRGQRGQRAKPPSPPEEKSAEDIVINEPTAMGLDDVVSVAPPSVPQPRRVQAELYHITPTGMDKLERSFTAGQPHHLTVWIGDPRTGAIQAEARFPEENLPKGLAFYPLTVIFSEPQHCPQPQTATIFLFPERRSSTECAFEFATRSDCPDFRGRLVISYQDQVLQTLLLTGKVLADPAQPGPETKFNLVVEADLQSDFNRAPEMPGRDAHLLAEIRSDDLCVYMQVKGQAREYCIPDFKPLIKTISEQFEVLAKTPDKFQKLSDPACEKLLCALAEHGYALYDELAAQLGSSHPIFQPDVTRLQLLSTQEALIPLELIYQADDFIWNGARLCPGAEQALREGQCKCKPEEEKAAAAGKAICPLRFWGLSRLIERHKIPREADLSEDLPRLNPTRDIPALNVVESAVFAASNRASDYVADLQTMVRDNFERASALLLDWDAWQQAVQEIKPSLLLMVPHAKEQDGFLALEIGKNSLLKVNQVREPYVRSQSDQHPVALILGCSTANSEISFESCASYFRRRGAALTVTTLSPVLARHVAPVAVCLLKELKLAAKEQRSFGTALLRTRQTALADGYPAVMTLIADGNMDWPIT